MKPKSIILLLLFYVGYFGLTYLNATPSTSPTMASHSSKKTMIANNDQALSLDFSSETHFVEVSGSK